MSKYSEMAFLDLRHLNAEAAKEIESISQIAVVVIPSDAEEETMAAIAAIPTSQVGMTLRLSCKSVVNSANGIVELGEADFSGEQDNVMIANGIVTIRQMPDTCHGGIAANGIVLFHESMREHCPIRIVALNGVKAFVNFETVKAYSTPLTLDAETIQYFNPNTALVCGSQLTFADDVTIELLKEKCSAVIAGGKVTCPAHLKGYLTAIGTCSAGIEAAQ